MKKPKLSKQAKVIAEEIKILTDKPILEINVAIQSAFLSGFACAMRILEEKKKTDEKKSLKT